MENSYHQKYLKYKSKYEKAKRSRAGNYDGELYGGAAAAAIQKKADQAACVFGRRPNERTNEECVTRRETERNAAKVIQRDTHIENLGDSTNKLSDYGKATAALEVLQKTVAAFDLNKSYDINGIKTKVGAANVPELRAINAGTKIYQLNKAHEIENLLKIGNEQVTRNIKTIQTQYNDLNNSVNQLNKRIKQIQELNLDLTGVDVDYGIPPELVIAQTTNAANP